MVGNIYFVGLDTVGISECFPDIDRSGGNLKMCTTSSLGGLVGFLFERKHLEWQSGSAMFYADFRGEKERILWNFLEHSDISRISRLPRLLDLSDDCLH